MTEHKPKKHFSIQIKTQWQTVTGVPEIGGGRTGRRELQVGRITDRRKASSIKVICGKLMVCSWRAGADLFHPHGPISQLSTRHLAGAHSFIISVNKYLLRIPYMSSNRPMD